ncbi:Protein involved in sporulation [Streptomyces sp. YIM 130001]|uniref:hypothetical protein n=1 Tax=Streptomyces sp. YIM 130001 TaxID=2259644 RepID=UPI000EBF93E8|nr:hypothetical protein [Streptomyces sp. YIM 130001]RII11160.1 Protein involved in sporulation [Streptomyces sp. YIM 130001]
MSRRKVNERLSALLTEAGWNGGQLARAVNALGSAQGWRFRYDRTSVAHWVAGSRPRPPVPELVAGAFTRQLRRLVTPVDTGLAQRGGSPDPLAVQPEGEAAVPGLIALCREDVDTVRRVPLARAVFTPVAPATLSASPVSAPAVAVGRHRATAADVSVLEEMTRVFAGVNQQHGGGSARFALATYIAEHTGELLSAAAADQVRQDLLTMASRLAYILAEMTADMHQMGLAQRYFHLALRLAQESQNRGQSAITLRAMSSLALRAGHVRHAVELADAAADLVAAKTADATVDAAVQSFVLTQRSLAHARDGMRHRALADLRRAEQLHARSEEHPDPFSAYSRASFDYQRAGTHAALGHRAECRRALTSSLRHRTPGEHRPLALTHSRIAEELIRRGELEEACANWLAFLEHCGYVRSAAVQQALGGLHQHLRPHARQPRAAEVLARARDFTVT